MSEGFKTKSAQAKESSRPGRKSTEIASIGAIQQSLVEHFSDIKDPRVERTKKHQLADILVIAILAVNVNPENPNTFDRCVPYGYRLLPCPASV